MYILEEEEGSLLGRCLETSIEISLLATLESMVENIGKFLGFFLKCERHMVIGSGV
jgi:hypothetical protein